MAFKFFGFGDSKKKKKYPTVIEELCHHFSFKDLRDSTNGFDVRLKIGRGCSSKVYKGCLNPKHNYNGDEETDYTIALKVLARNSHQGSVQFKKGIEMLCQLRHPNVISLIGFCYQEKEMIGVYEYMPNGTLSDYMRDKNREPLSWNKRLEICIGVARGLHYLHAGAKRCIVHRDIKPSNILLDRNMVPKISDFGLSLQGALSTSKPKRIQVDHVAGTLGYLAPEQFLDKVVTDKTDVFSFGMVLIHVVTNTDLHHVLREIQDNHITLEVRIDPILKGKIASESWQVFTNVIQSCLEYEADERPTMGEVEVLLEHALSLQQQADITNINNAAHYTLLSTTHLSDLLKSSDIINKDYLAYI
ncbi:hypothetical protein PIB30_093379 [Stylosanthes scabra]|uniref:Protein kinase domain-containing protein n=1 Tax=Stylosanthes scabra TaxID=79078 RepID=A0ABU6QUH1_9FABA|nr:hypothetical protein [Stylosanthes scabra]